jgi:hypothetical protein
MVLMELEDKMEMYSLCLYGLSKTQSRGLGDCCIERSYRPR